MKNFSQFNEEISIRGNKGVPEEKLRDIERKGAEKIRGAVEHQLGGRLMQLIRQSGPFIRGNQKQLEELAVEVIRKTYGLILKNVDIQADLVSNGNAINDFMKQEDEEKEEEQKELEEEIEERKEELEKQLEEADEDEKEEIEDLLKKLENGGEEPLSPEAVKMAVDVRKLMNNIIQGEAKNTKHMLHTDEIKQGLEKIYGARWREAFNVWDEITKTADKMDWIIPINFRAQMMENHPGGMAGCVSCRFPRKKLDLKTKKEKDAEKKAKEDLLKAIANGEDITKKGEEVQKLLGDSKKKPIIKVKAIDFPMLLHELVKGVYEMITQLALPKQKSLREEALRQTSSFADEVEDWRYGPYLAEDLNNFIMKNPKINTYPNIKEYVFGMLIDKKRYSDEQILLNLKNIFLESPEGIKLRDKLVDEVIAQLKGYYDQMEEFKRKKEEREREEKEAEEWSKQVSKEEESEIDKLVKKSLYGDKDKEKAVVKKSYDEMSIAEIQAEIEKAVEEENYELAGELTKKYLKGESRKVWEMELMRINESHQYHSRRK